MVHKYIQAPCRLVNGGNIATTPTGPDNDRVAFVTEQEARFCHSAHRSVQLYEVAANASVQAFVDLFCNLKGMGFGPLSEGIAWMRLNEAAEFYQKAGATEKQKALEQLREQLLERIDVDEPRVGEGYISDRLQPLVNDFFTQNGVSHPPKPCLHRRISMQ